MSLLPLLFIGLGIALPVMIYLLRESRYRNPASRWPHLARMMEFKYSANPPRLSGEWKGRNLEVVSVETDAYIAMPVSCNGIRLEIGPREEVEKAAGIVVPDRVSFGDSRFDESYVVRSTPIELGQEIAPDLRQKLLQLPSLSILAMSNRVQVRMAPPTEAGQLRDAMDVAVSIADLVDR